MKTPDTDNGTTTKNSQKIPQEAFDWYDEYAHGLIDRRTYLRRLTRLTAAGVSFSLLSSALMPNYALAEQVSFNDPAIKAQYLTFDSPIGHGKGRGYFVTPTEIKAKAPGVLVIHENRGLNPYVKDVARRLAKAGFVSFAPDALFPVGGYPGNDDEGRAMQREMDRGKIEEDFIAAAKFLKTHAQTTDKLGAVGFCFGGYIVNTLAARMGGDLDAGVPFYGTPAAEDLQKNIRSPLMIQLASKDERVNASWPAYEKNLKKYKVDYTMHMYEGANHGFHNDSTARYDKAAAELAWQRTLAFFDKHLKLKT